MRSHCAHARFVWNLCVEQQSWWRPGRTGMPGWAKRCQQLTEARAESDWLRAGSSVVQSQALRDFDRAREKFFAGAVRKPTWRKAGRDEGFRVQGLGRDYKMRRLSRKVGAVQIPKVGWVRFRWSRAVPASTKSYRVKMDRAGRWHIAFTAIPEPVGGPGTGEVVGVDRGVAVSAALSTGDLLNCPGLRATERARLLRLQRRLARAERESKRRARLKLAIAAIRARETDRRQDWAEKLSTDLARRFDVIRVEDLKVKNMVLSARGTLAEPGRNVRAKGGLNRAILGSGWGTLVRRLGDKAPGRVEKVKPQFTSQRCSACGHTSAENRKSQAVFACVACHFTLNADVNAALNIAAGHAVTARGGPHLGPLNREPQLALLSA